MQESQEIGVRSLRQEDPPVEEMATHSSVLGWRIPWTEKPGGPQSMGSPRVGYVHGSVHLRNFHPFPGVGCSWERQEQRLRGLRDTILERAPGPALVTGAQTVPRSGGPRPHPASSCDSRTNRRISQGSPDTSVFPRLP